MVLQCLSGLYDPYFFRYVERLFHYSPDFGTCSFYFLSSPYLSRSISDYYSISVTVPGLPKNVVTIVVAQTELIDLDPYETRPEASGHMDPTTSSNYLFGKFIVQIEHTNLSWSLSFRLSFPLYLSLPVSCSGSLFHSSPSRIRTTLWTFRLYLYYFIVTKEIFFTFV